MASQPTTERRRARNSQPRRWLTQAEVADHLDVSVRTVRNYISTGYLTGYRLGKRGVRVDAHELDELLKPIPTVSDVA